MKDVGFDAETVRVVLHILGVCVWVGGQIVVGAIVPVLKRTNPEAVINVARAFGRIGWPFLDWQYLPEYGTWCLCREPVPAGTRC